MYIPPFTVSAEAINLIAEISGQIERYAIRLEQEDGLRLRKANRIKTIHSSLAIPSSTAADAAEQLGMTQRGAEKLMKRLKEAGVISREGSRKNGIWIIQKSISKR